MFGSDLYIALVLGVTLSLIYTEKTGILPSGLIVAGCLSLIFNQPVFMVTSISYQYFNVLNRNTWYSMV